MNLTPTPKPNKATSDELSGLSAPTPQERESLLIEHPELVTERDLNNMYSLLPGGFVRIESSLYFIGKGYEAGETFRQHLTRKGLEKWGENNSETRLNQTPQEFLHTIDSVLLKLGFDLKAIEQSNLDLNKSPSSAISIGGLESRERMIKHLNTTFCKPLFIEMIRLGYRPADLTR